MKQHLIIFSVLFLLFSCGTNKNVPDNSLAETTAETTQVEDDTQVDPNMEAGGVITTDGIVKDQSEKGCGFVIEVLFDNVSNKSNYLQPLDLPAAYQVDGKPIRFSYRMSRRPSTCDTALPIIIDKIVD